MTDFRGVNYARTQAVPQQSVDGGDFGGRTRHVYDDYLTTGAETTNDRIFVGQLSPGERLLDGWVQWGPLGGAVTLRLGDAGDDDRLLAATSAAASGTARFTALTALGFKPGGNQRVPVFLTIGGGTVGVGQGIKVMLAVGRD